MTIKSTSLLLQSLLILFVTCTSPTLGQVSGSGNGTPGQKDKLKGDAPDPYFRLSDADRRTFIEKVKKLPIGNTREATERLLGTPWSDEVATSKRERKFIGRFVTYYLVKNSKDLVNNKLDQYVLLKFGKDDRLQEILCPN